MPQMPVTMSFSIFSVHDVSCHDSEILHLIVFPQEYSYFFLYLEKYHSSFKSQLNVTFFFCEHFLDFLKQTQLLLLSQKTQSILLLQQLQSNTAVTCVCVYMCMYVYICICVYMHMSNTSSVFYYNFLWYRNPILVKIKLNCRN